MSSRRAVLLALSIVLTVAGCGSAADDSVVADDSAAADEPETSDEPAGSDEPTASDEPAASDESVELYPDVVGVEAELSDDGSWTFSVTLSSPYDTPQRYADAWRVVDPDSGEEYGIRPLAHDHQNEQPFTRSQSGITIPESVDAVLVEGRDQISGWGGASVEFELVR